MPLSSMSEERELNNSFREELKMLKLEKDKVSFIFGRYIIFDDYS